MPSASSPPRKRARKAIIQLRLSTQAAERLESLLRENRGNEIKAVVDESGGTSICEDEVGMGRGGRCR